MTHLAAPPGCEAIAELLPWHANGTLGAIDRTTVDTHIAECGACRTTLAVEKRIVEAIRAPRDNVEQSPHAGWQKLAARLDGDVTAEHSVEALRAGADRVIARAAEANSAVGPLQSARRRINWPVALGAAVAVQAAAIAVLTFALVRHRQAEMLAPSYLTVADPDPTLASKGSLVRVALDHSADEVTARGLAQALSGRILAGPSPDNVYTFEFSPGQGVPGVDEKVTWLRRQAHVLLVAPVVLGPRPAAKP